MLGCAQHSTIIPFHRATEAAERPVRVAVNYEHIGIFRSAHPFTRFDELGIITFRTNAPSLTMIYERLREDAAPQGADAVIDVRIKPESHTEMDAVPTCVPRTVCTVNGCSTTNICSSRSIPREVSTFLVEGSMIRSIQ